jgi:hypothetical protein
MLASTTGASGNRRIHRSGFIGETLRVTAVLREETPYPCHPEPRRWRRTSKCARLRRYTERSCRKFRVELSAQIFRGPSLSSASLRQLRMTPPLLERKFLVSGFWFLVSGFWFLVSGFWFLVPGFWFVSAFWFLVSAFCLLPSDYRVRPLLARFSLRSRRGRTRQRPGLLRPRRERASFHWPWCGARRRRV